MKPQNKVRKRVCKACDRCRLKKSKCDGLSACSRCKADNTMCVFGERKKLQDKVYPKGYAEMLEQQQAQLVAGLQELYNRLQKGESWPGKPLRKGPGGYALTHDILERLNMLYVSSENNGDYRCFEEDSNRTQQRLLERGAPVIHRLGSVTSESEEGHASVMSSYEDTPTTRSFISDDSFATSDTPPTLPVVDNFTKQLQITSPVEQEPPMVFPTSMSLDALDTSTSQIAWPGCSWMEDNPVDLFEPLSGFRGFEFDETMITIALNSNGNTMQGWSTTQDLNFNSLQEKSIGA